MIVRVTDTLQASFDYPEDFGHFSVQIESAIAGLDDAQRALCRIAVLEDRETAWVEKAALRA